MSATAKKATMVCDSTGTVLGGTWSGFAFNAWTCAKRSKTLWVARCTTRS